MVDVMDDVDVCVLQISTSSAPHDLLLRLMAVLPEPKAQEPLRVARQDRASANDSVLVNDMVITR